MTGRTPLNLMSRLMGIWWKRSVPESRRLALSAPMKQSIELHDSKLAAVSFRSGEAVVSFSPAYIHRSTGRPGIDAGTVWVQPVTLTIGGASLVSTPTSLPATVSGGYIRI